MEKSHEKPHKFDIGEGYGIWEDPGRGIMRSFPDVFYRAKPGDSAGKYMIGDMAIMRQPSSNRRFGMFVIANVETGDFGGTGLKYKITVHSYGMPEDLAEKSSINAIKAELAPSIPCVNADADGYCTGPCEGSLCCKCTDYHAASGTTARPTAEQRQQADNSKKEPKMKRPTYKMQRIKLADCKPHADAEAYSASTEDRAALSNSIGEAGILSPIAVVPDEDGRGWYVIDGIGRMNALIAAGETETEAQVFDLGDLTVAEFVVCKNAMMRKVTTGTRVMAYLKCHEREVLAATDPKNYNLRANSFKPKRGAVSHETAPDKGWSAKEIAERIGVSKNDVLAGIELLKATGECGEESRQDGGSPSAKYVQLDLFETMDSVMHGETPIRRWKAAACGKVSKVGGKAAADYEGIAIRTMKSLAGVWANWQTIPMEGRAPVMRLFGHALHYLPEDFRAVIADELLLTEAALPGKGKGKRR